MGLQTNSNKLQATRGFTIVELLIVIVVIAILAAITIVAYNGITARANSSSALASAQNVAKKLEAYNAEEGQYPASISLLTADSSKAYYVPTGTIAATTTILAAKPTSATTVTVHKCGTGTNQAVITGLVVTYWKYDGTPGANPVNVGQVSGTVPPSTAVTCATTSYNS